MNGKGDKRRPGNYKDYCNNFDKINWGVKVEEDTVIPLERIGDHESKIINGRKLNFVYLLDSKGNKIYEGDILDWGVWDNGEGERAYVYYDKKYYAYAVYYYSKYGGEGFDLLYKFLDLHKDDTIKIISNILLD
jgi:hypothetical protein